MKDYKNLTPPSIDRDISHLSTFASLAGILAIIWLMAASCVDGVVKQSELDEETAKRRTYVEQTYKNPAAYRLQSPTQAEMDHVHGLLAVQEVMR